MGRQKLLFTALLAITLHAQQFSDAERKFLDSADEALGVHAGAVIADIGTGRAVYNPLRIAEKVGISGKVVCVDIRRDMIDSLREQAESHHLKNIEAILGKEDDPLLAAGAFDGVFVSHTYHEFTKPVAMLKHIHDALKSEGVLLVLESYTNTDRSTSRLQQAKWHDLLPEILERELSAAGFITEGHTDLVPPNGGKVQYFIKAKIAK